MVEWKTGGNGGSVIGPTHQTPLVDDGSVVRRLSSATLGSRATTSDQTGFDGP